MFGRPSRKRLSIFEANPSLEMESEGADRRIRLNIYSNLQVVNEGIKYRQVFMTVIYTNLQTLKR